MKRTKLAGRYAKALFEFAQEIKQIENISNDITFINNTFLSSKELRAAINSPIIRTDKKIGIIEKIFQYHITETTFKYLLLILRKGREIQINTICDEYVKLYKAYKNIVSVNLYSAKKLEPSTIETIKNKVQSFMQANIEIIEHIKPNLIGGVVIKFNDYCIDASVKNHIEKLKKELIDKSYQINF